MPNSTNDAGFPSLDEIQALANSFFKSFQGQQNAERTPVAEAYPNVSHGPTTVPPIGGPRVPSHQHQGNGVPSFDGTPLFFSLVDEPHQEAEERVSHHGSASGYQTGVPSQDRISVIPRGLPESLNFGLAPSDGLSSTPADGRQPRSVATAREDFPILREKVNGKPLIWFDNAATTQKPKSVIDRLTYFYEHENSNIHRAAHTVAARATDAYEKSRETVRRFLNAGSTDEVIFVRGATEGINLIACTWGEQNIHEGDEILLTQLEHHANIVPWKRLADRRGAKIVVAPVDESGQIILPEFARLLSHRTKLLSFTLVSNALGTITPAREMIALARSRGVTVVVDGAQSVSHLRTDVQSLDADFFVFSGHKVYGPTGIGAVFGKKHLLQSLPPYQSGGNMISDVTFENISYHDAPARFEAGTGNIADAVGLGQALEYVESIGIENIAAHEHVLLQSATEGLIRIPGLRLIGTASNKAGVISFTIAGLSTAEIGAALDKEGIAVRSGHHCAQPILRRFGVETTVRPSFAVYNTLDEVQQLIEVVERVARRV